jgi:hypothetical protein
MLIAAIRRTLAHKRGANLMRAVREAWAGCALPRYPLIVEAVNIAQGAVLPDRPAIATITAWPCSSDCVLPLTF